MHILGIDPGTGRTGWGVIDQKDPNTICYVAHGCIITTQDDTMQNRLKLIHENLQSIIREYNPVCMAVEQIFFGLNARTAISVSQARGVVMLTCAQEGLPFFEYTSLAVKFLLAGSGRTDKKEMQTVVRRLLSKNSTTLAFSAKDKAFDDAADALAIAIHHSWKSTGKDKEIAAKTKLDKENGLIKIIKKPAKSRKKG